MGTAVRINDFDTEFWRGEARLYRIDPPISYEYFPMGEDTLSRADTDHLVVSMLPGADPEAVTIEPETVAFAADREGNVLTWRGLTPRLDGEEAPEKLLSMLGYAVSEGAE